MTSEVHIASFIVQLKPDRFYAVQREFKQVPWLDCPVADEQQCKLLVLLEEPTTRALDERINWMKDVPGVLSVTMVYHQVEPATQLDQEVVAWV